MQGDLEGLIRPVNLKPNPKKAKKHRSVLEPTNESEVNTIAGLDTFPHRARWVQWDNEGIIIRRTSSPPGTFLVGGSYYQSQA